MATLWIVASGGVIALLLIFLTDTARLYLARIEMQNALDAAVLSAVKSRCQNGVTASSNEAARHEARAAYLANFPSTATPSAVSLSLNSNLTANGNGNDRCPPLTSCPDGLVLLGSVYFPSQGVPATLTFDADVAPDKARVVVEAGPATDTYGAAALFKIRVEGAPPGNVASLTIDLSSAGAAIFDPGAGASEADGYGPFPTAPVAPIASYSLSASSPSDARLTVTFDGGLTAGASATFGIDTDLIANPLTPMPSARLHGANISIRFSDGSTHATTLVSQGGLQVRGEVLIGVHECAVQAYGCVEVPSIAPSFLGLLFGPYQVHGRSTAWLRCAGAAPEPELVRVDQVICEGFVLP